MVQQNIFVQSQWEAFCAFLQKQNARAPLALAFSGGLDSRFVAHAAQKAGCDVVLYHAIGAHIPRAESFFAKEWAKARNLPFQEFTVSVDALEHVSNNSPERCYYCKKHLLALFMQVACEEGRQLCDGTNADDMLAHRPGLRALQEQGVLSPLAQCSVDKNTVRLWGAHTGLEYVTQKASPCLLTRLQYGMLVEADTLIRIDDAETALRALGIAECRLRLTPEPVVQINPYTEDCTGFESAIHALLAEYGFYNVKILVEENLSGFFDRK